jgi:hypothetical protein
VAALAEACAVNPWWRLNLLLALCAAGLLAALFWPQTDDLERLSPLQVEAIDTIRIERDGRLRLALERHDDRWQMSHPGPVPAQAARVAQLLAIAQAPLRRSFAPRQPLEDYGLAPPAALLQFNRMQIGFGARDPSQRQRYVLVDGRVGLVDDVYFNLLTLPPSHFTGD